MHRWTYIRQVLVWLPWSYLQALPQARGKLLAPIQLCQTCFDSACVCDAVLEQVDVIYSRSKARPDVRHMDWDQFARALRMVAEKRYPDLVKNGYRAVGPGTAAGLLAVLRRHVLASKSESWITQVVNV